MQSQSTSVINMLNAFRLENPEVVQDIPVWHFCDNKIDANDCGELVLSGDKQATSPSLWGIERRKEPMPQVGDLDLITNWQGEALAIIQTKSVKLVAFNKISQAYAFKEGEGDKSLTYWKEVHWLYYQRELAPFDMEPTTEMPIVCIEFEVIFKL